MCNLITPLNWRSEFERSEVDSIGMDFILLDKPMHLPLVDYPFKLDITVVIICVSGSMEGSVNLKDFRNEGPGLFILLPDQILQYKYLSDDFSGYFIVMSKEFTGNLLIDIRERFPIFQAIQENPWALLNEKELKSMIDYYTLFQSTVQMTSNPYRIEVIKHLMQALFYGLSYNLYKLDYSEQRSKQEILVKSFLDLVKNNYKKKRSLDFYAEKLYLTPKYLSKVVKQVSGSSANEWITDFVILEAKALLRSTNMTIQQVALELNFPSQSFFGKYFKRYAGVSPKDYRNS
jgi:AraC-like DNA-binding protein